jgi:hypothetical protein
MAFRILWHDGWPYPVTGHPFQYDAEEVHWFVQTRDGSWRQVVRRQAGTSLDDVWEELEPVVRDWLAVNVPSEAPDMPPMLVVEVALHPFSGRFESERVVLARTVSTSRGECYVELTTASVLPNISDPDPMRRSRNGEPGVFNVKFRTSDYPFGVHLQFDATEFLETVVQRYLQRHPNTTPISEPTESDQ